MPVARQVFKERRRLPQPPRKHRRQRRIGLGQVRRDLCQRLSRLLARFTKVGPRGPPRFPHVDESVRPRRCYGTSTGGSLIVSGGARGGSTRAPGLA
jgi:hypothetical protein